MGQLPLVFWNLQDLIQPVWQPGAPAPILTIWSLLLLKAGDDRVFRPPLISPFKNDCAAVPAFAASRNAKPAPVSIKFTEKDLRLRDDLLVFLLTAMFGVSP